MDQRSDASLDAALADDRGQAIALNVAPVSRETWARLDAFVGLLLTWQRTINLVAPSTLPTVWTRHVADSLQLLPLAPPNAAHWVDLGSGGGFPGIVIACALAGRPDARIDLVESNRKKAAFLREAIRMIEVPGVVHATRIEDFVTGSVDVVTARALAPLDRLLGLANPLLTTGALGLFPKGQDVEAELTQASKSWTIDAELIASKTDPRGRILRVRRAELSI